MSLICGLDLVVIVNLVGGVGKAGSDFAKVSEVIMS